MVKGHVVGQKSREFYLWRLYFVLYEQNIGVGGQLLMLKGVPWGGVLSANQGKERLKRWDQQKDIWRVKSRKLYPICIYLLLYIYFYIYTHVYIYIEVNIYIYIYTWFLKIWITTDCLLFLVWKVSCESGISTFLCERMHDVLPNLISYVLNISCVLLL